MQFILPPDDQTTVVPAGWWTLDLLLSTTGQPDRVTTEIPFAVAPTITSAMPMTVARDPDGAAAVTLAFAPRMLPGQRIALLLGSREVSAPPTAAADGGDQMTFTVTAAEPGRHLARLRIDGVDSRFIDRGTTSPVFDDSQAVTVTA